MAFNVSCLAAALAHLMTDCIIKLSWSLLLSYEAKSELSKIAINCIVMAHSRQAAASDIAILGTF